MLKKLVNYVLDSSSGSSREKQLNTIRRISASADGAYDSNSNFRHLEEKGIKFNKGRKKFIISSRTNRLKNRKVKLQSKDLLKWKTKRKYEHRWMTETAFSIIKRMFGEHVSATRFRNMVKEMMIKVSLYYLFRRI
jgi:hypothetical protein